MGRWGEWVVVWENRNVYKVLMGKHETTPLMPPYQTTRRLFPLLAAVRL
jgi:hypothetical protein